MRRPPRSPGSAAPSLAVVLVGLLALVVLGGTALGYARWQDDVDTATDRANQEAATRTDEDLPAAPDTPDEVVGDDPGEDTSKPGNGGSGNGGGNEASYEDPTFQPLEPTENRPQPVVLLVGGGYADGAGASSAGTSWPSLLARDLGWDVRLATAPDAGYSSPTPTLLDLLEQAPPSLAPDLVVVQGTSSPDETSDSDADTRAAVEELRSAIEQQYGDVPLAVLTTLAPDAMTRQQEDRERTEARTWREDPDVLVVRPSKDGWAEVTRDDAGHELVATRLLDAFRRAGLAVTSE